MSNYTPQATELEASLQLALPPVAIAFADELPAGISPYDEVAPAGCYFWQEASQKVFATSAQDHELCAIGVHTHNLSGASATQPAELMTALEAMQGLDYVREEEVAAIPVPAAAGSTRGLRSTGRLSHDRRCSPALRPRATEPDFDRSGGQGRRGCTAGNGKARPAQSSLRSEMAEKPR